MRTVKPLKHGHTMLSIRRPDMCGGFYWSGVLIDEDGVAYNRATWSDGVGIPLPEFEDVFGRLGYRTLPMESIYYHAAMHTARM